DPQPADRDRLAGGLHAHVSMRNPWSAGEEVNAHLARLFQVADAAVGHATSAPQGSEDGGVHLAPKRTEPWRLLQVLHHHHARSWHLAHVLVERRLVAVRRRRRAAGCGRTRAAPARRNKASLSTFSIRNPASRQRMAVSGPAQWMPAIKPRRRHACRIVSIKRRCSGALAVASGFMPWVTARSLGPT